MIKAILFDFDGVLVPIDPEIKQKMKQSIIEKYSLSASVTFQKARSHVEKAIKNCKTDEAYFKLADVAVEMGTHDKGEINALFHTLTKNRTFKLDKNILEMLDHLFQRGIKLGIVSLSSIDRLEQTLETMQIRKYFCHIQSAANELQKTNRSEWKKPAYSNFLSSHAFKSDEVLSVGDSFSIDLKPARELGMQTALMIDHEYKDMQGNKCLADYELPRRMLSSKILTVLEGK